MTQKFKVGDIVYCRYYKKKGIVSSIYVDLDIMHVSLFTTNFTTSYRLNGELFPEDETPCLKKVKVFNPQDMIAFANYCIGEGFTSNATGRDLVTFLNSRKE
jgi:hypothetical protein